MESVEVGEILKMEKIRIWSDKLKTVSVLTLRFVLYIITDASYNIFMKSEYHMHRKLIQTTFVSMAPIIIIKINVIELRSSYTTVMW